MTDVTAVAPPDLVGALEEHRAALTAQCRWILGSRAEAEDAVQETMVRAWQAFGEYEGRGSLLGWLRSIARNVCLDMLRARQRRPQPADPEAWDVQPQPMAGGAPPAADGDPAERAVAGDEVRRAFVAALLHLSPRERSALLLCEVLRWRASEAAELMGTSVAAVNSALQRARATLPGAPADDARLDDEHRARLHRYVDAFLRHDVDLLATLVRHHEAGEAAGVAGAAGAVTAPCG